MDNVKYLLSKGANLNVIDDLGFSPFIEACRSGKLELIQPLLVSGADLNIRSNNDDTPLKFALISNRFVKMEEKLMI